MRLLLVLGVIGGCIFNLRFLWAMYRERSSVRVLRSWSFRAKPRTASRSRLIIRSCGGRV